jgi:hypothetical protein
MRYDGFPRGMNNRAKDHDLPPGTLRNAVNIDIDNQGNLSRRKGMEKVLGGIGMHSGWSCDAWSLVVVAGRLKIFNADHALTDLMPVHGPVCYEELNGIVYFSDGVGSYKLLPDGSVVNWGIAPPPAPIVSTISGDLAAGRYLIAITPIASDGSEHGASPLVSIDLDADSGLSLTLPNAGDPQVEYLRVYLSTANGKVLYAVKDVPLNSGSTTVTAEPGSGVALETIGVTGMRPCRRIVSYRGRIYAEDAEQPGVLWHSDPLAYDRLRPGRNFLLHKHPIDLLAADSNGLWVAEGERTIFYSGAGPEDFAPVDALDYGAVPGFPVKQKSGNTTVLYWYSTRGIVRVNNGIANLQEDNVAVETGDSAALMVRESNGLKQAIASVGGAQVSHLAAGSFLEMEVIRKSGN